MFSYCNGDWYLTPSHFKRSRQNKHYFFSHIKSAVSVLGWGGSLSRGDLRVELLLFCCSLTSVDGG